MATRRATQASALAVGIIYPFGGTTAPTGYLLCDGHTELIATYPGLAAILGTTFGNPGDGISFTLPDLRGRTLFGFDNMGGTAASRLIALDKFVPSNGAGELHYLLINYIIKA